MKDQIAETRHNPYVNYKTQIAFAMIKTSYFKFQNLLYILKQQTREQVAI